MRLHARLRTNDHSGTLRAARPGRSMMNGSIFLGALLAAAVSAVPLGAQDVRVLTRRDRREYRLRA